jgi:hypothetical protein
MLQVSAIIHNQRQADAWAEFQKAYLGTYSELPVPSAPTVTSTPEGQKAAASTVAISPEKAKKQIEASAEKPTPLEVAIEEKKAAQDAQPAEPVADPFAQLQSGMEPAATEAAETAAKVEEKPKKTRAKKEAAPEPEKPAEAKPLDIAAIRSASTIALELVGAPTLQEALAKFEAVDANKVLRMTALREADYALYIEYLKKKVNDAAKAWPDDEAKFLADAAARRAA